MFSYYRIYTIQELPFKLDFDEYEDENPAIDNQRFYGFKQLSLSNNTNDATFMRDAVTSDILAEAGLTSAETAFYELFVDYGDGAVSFGLYTMIEVVDDTVENDIVVFAAARQFLHPVAVLRGDVGQQLNGDGAVFQFDQDGVFGIFIIGHRALHALC